MDRNVNGGMRVCGRVHGLEQHGAFVLVEEFGCGVDVVVCTGVGTAYHHDGKTGCGRGGGVIDAVVVHRGLEEVGVVFEPGVGVSRRPSKK